MDLSQPALGVNFAPTPDNALNGPRNGALAGVPQAIQFLSFNLPRILGVKPIAPGQLLNAQGAHGQDPYASALASLMRAMAAYHTSAAPTGAPPIAPPPPHIQPGARGPNGAPAPAGPAGIMAPPPSGSAGFPSTPTMPNPRPMPWARGV